MNDVAKMFIDVLPEITADICEQANLPGMDMCITAPGVDSVEMQTECEGKISKANASCLAVAGGKPLTVDNCRDFEAAWE